MKYKLLFFLFFLTCCDPQLSSINQQKLYTAKGFALIYNDLDLNKKIIRGKMNNDVMELSIQNLKTGSLIKVINPKNKESLVFKNTKRVKYPKFYKIIITKPVADKLGLNPSLPILEILEVKKNKSFIAKKAKIFSEEKKTPSKAPVASVKILNISKNKENKVKKNSTDQIFINVATFYSSDTANFLKKRIINEVKDLDSKKLKVKKINNKETRVILGPYSSVNSLKNDYIKLNNIGFEEMDIYINE